VNHQRTHRNHPAAANGARNGSDVRGVSLNLAIRKNSIAMRAGQDSQRAIRCSGVIQVHPQGQYLFESFLRSVSVENAAFLGPWSPPNDFFFLDQWKRCVLMPCHEPVRGRSFVKQSGRKGTAPLPSTARAICESCAVFASDATAGCDRTWRAPARLRFRLAIESSAPSREISVEEKMPGKYAYPFASMKSRANPRNCCGCKTSY
jgi:hypothetical protein